LTDEFWLSLTECRATSRVKKLCSLVQDDQARFFKFIYLFRDNFATGVGLITPILWCHDELI